MSCSAIKELFFFLNIFLLNHFMQTSKSFVFSYPKNRILDLSAKYNDSKKWKNFLLLLKEMLSVACHSRHKITEHLIHLTFQLDIGIIFQSIRLISYLVIWHKKQVMEVVNRYKYILGFQTRAFLSHANNSATTPNKLNKAAAEWQFWNCRPQITLLEVEFAYLCLKLALVFPLSCF